MFKISCARVALLNMNSGLVNLFSEVTTGLGERRNRARILNKALPDNLLSMRSGGNRLIEQIEKTGPDVRRAGFPSSDGVEEADYGIRLVAPFPVDKWKPQGGAEMNLHGTTK